MCKYYIYILRSKKDGSFYKGFTNDLSRRLHEHNSGKSQFTSSKIPWELIYWEEFNTKAEAIYREKYLKSAAGRRYIKKLNL
jgi:putative endonuclease